MLPGLSSLYAVLSGWQGIVIREVGDGSFAGAVGVAHNGWYVRPVGDGSFAISDVVQATHRIRYDGGTFYCEVL